MKTTNLPSTNSVNRSLLRAFLLIPLAFACFALSLQAQTCQEGCDINLQNTFFGDDALMNDGGGGNTAVGALALVSPIGGGNTAIGAIALRFSTTGLDNTAVGVAVLQGNTTGSFNTATGWDALVYNTTGDNNTATGSNALFQNTIGRQNTANGFAALEFNTTGNFNTASGVGALFSNTSGSNNIALGYQAGVNLTTGRNNIDIGDTGVANDSNKIRIGTNGTHTNTFIAGISGATVPTGVAVIVDADGHLGTTTSSARFKEAVKPMDKASEAILALKPVTFRYKHDFDPEGIPQFGLVAEQVEKVNPDLVARDEQGKPYTVRYEAVNAMLLNEFLKEHRKVESLEKAMAEQQKENAAMRAMLKNQVAQIRKVSAQLEASKPLLQTIANNQ